MSTITTLRRTTGLLLISAFVALFMAACGGGQTTQATPTPTAPTSGGAITPTESEWDALVSAAKAEGRVEMFACCVLGANLDRFNAAFEQEYGIEVNGSTGSPVDAEQRIRAERDGGRYTIDVYITGGVSFQRLVDAGAVDPIEPLLVHPDVTDLSNWYGGQYFYGDGESKQHLLAFGLNATNSDLSFNTDMVSTGQITSYWDLLKPEWHGKIVMPDIRSGGQGGTPLAFMYTNPDLGPEFLRRLLTETDITLAPNIRQAAEWTAQGRYAICIFSCNIEINALRESGLPVEERTPLLAEGGYIQASPNFVGAINTPANPSAQKLYLNWFLGKAAQTAVQEITGDNSTRIDIPKDMVDEHKIPLEGVEYDLFQFHPEYPQWTLESRQLLIDALASVGK